MTIPRFTAEAALYQTNGQYRTGKNMSGIQLPAQSIGMVYPARDEVIVLHSCPPGWSDIGGSCWPDPLTEQGGSGGGGSSGSGAVDEDSGPGGGDSGEADGVPSKKPPIIPRYKPTVGGRCRADELRKDGSAVFVARGTYTKLPGDIWFCCDSKSTNECIQCPPEGDPATRCANGWG